MSKLLKRIFSYSRYLTLGLMDAGLTSLSVLCATYLSGISNGWEVLRFALSVGVGLAAANFSGAYLAEEAEAAKEITRIENAMGLKKGGLRSTSMEEKLKAKGMDRALINSLSAFIGIAIATVPMAFIRYPESYYYGFSAAMVQIILLGFYLGKLAKRNVTGSILKVVAVSLGVIIINLLFSQFG
ncbi:MAG: hypothetical protein ABIG96_01890 [Candidatus Micrarchaeota archaeon]